MKKIFFLIVVLLNLLSLRAEQNIKKLFDVANKKYEAKLYQEAIEDYLTILNSGQKSDVIHYNLGNCYYKTKLNSKAILSYEKALKINPNNVNAKKNLALARLKLEDKIDPRSDIIITKAWIKFKHVFSANQWTIVSIVLFWSTILCASLILFLKQSRSKKISFLFCGLFFALWLVCSIIAYERYLYLSSKSEAIIFSPTTSLKASPDTNSKTLATLHEGTKLFLLDNIGLWYKVKLEDDRMGWLEQNNFESY